MNREILFKAKRKDNGEWVYGHYLKTTKDNRHYIYNGEYSELVSIINGIETFEPSRYNMQIIEVIPETICQYTGLDDKNGVKIFENDVVKNVLILKSNTFCENIDIVEFNQEDCSFMLGKDKRHFNKNLDLEVIKNKFDEVDNNEL